MVGLTVQNFVSAAMGMAVLAALARGIARRGGRDDRQFLGRSDADDAVHPAAAVPASLAIGLVSQGVVQTLVRLPARRRLSRAASRLLPMGPAASQIAIKQLGTNGGGFFNVNSAHPFENPTPLSNFVADAGDPAHPGRSLLHVRPHGGRPAPGVGAACRHGAHLRPLRSAHRRPGIEREPEADAT